MKYCYKGLQGIAALKLKREDEKKNAKKRKPWSERRGLVSRVCHEMLLAGNRRERRRIAKMFIKDPLNNYA